MSTNFTSLRNNRKNLLTKLAEEAKKTTQKGGGADERFWKLSVDAKTSIGYAKIRFLPAPKNEDLPWARVFSHGFKTESGSWFIENCPTTLADRPCPVCKNNNKLWNSGIESDKNIVRDRKRKQSYISNILVVDDPAHPENNGKVFLYKYGPKIHTKIMELLEPQFPDQKPANPFDLWEGCDFKLKSQKVAGYQNYDKSEFAEPSELFEDDDAKKEATWESEFSLTEFTHESQFKDYDDLDKRLTKALSGDSGDGPRTAADAIERDAELPIAKPAVQPKSAEAAVGKTAKAAAPKAPVAIADDEDEDEDDVKKFFAGVLDSEG